MRIKRRGLAGLAAGTVGAALVAGTVMALCYGPHEGAYRLYDPSGSTQGLKGGEDLVSATVASGRAIAHPAQVVSATTTDFLGWGTEKGNGPDDCADYYGSGWQVYVDGVAFGAYFCDAPWATLSATAQNQTFQIEYHTCPFYPYSQRWVFYWAGTIETCRSTNFTASPDVSAGSESVGTTADQNIDVHWETMKYLNSSGTWTNWGDGENCANSPYRVRVIANTAFWTELP
jgi:hypothetical protein